MSTVVPPRDETVEALAIRARNQFLHNHGQYPTHLLMSPRTYSELCRALESMRAYSRVSSVSRLCGCEVVADPGCLDNVVIPYREGIGYPWNFTRNPALRAYIQTLSDHSTDALAYATSQVRGSFESPPDEAPRAKDPLKDPAFLAEVRRIENLPRPGVEKTLPWYGDDQLRAAAFSEEQHGTSP